ncbi:MAG TPA: single-stranded DNA-binding protein, partial [Clostridiales bacterium]|nr:single-stranded DNA-binding protein [Clostridiales bacterium]
RNKLNVVVFAREFNLLDDYEKIEHENKINLEGFICKKPIGRVSPLGREICDIMLAVNRMYNKSDYIPCIAWGRNAGYASNLAVGTKISIAGRIQSREYKKRDAEGNVTEKVAYEVSILKLEALST